MSSLMDLDGMMVSKGLVFTPSSNRRPEKRRKTPVWISYSRNSRSTILTAAIVVAAIAAVAIPVTEAVVSVLIVLAVCAGLGPMIQCYWTRVKLCAAGGVAAWVDHLGAARRASRLRGRCRGRMYDRSRCLEGLGDVPLLEVLYPPLDAVCVHCMAAGQACPLKMFVDAHADGASIPGCGRVDLGMISLKIRDIERLARSLISRIILQDKNFVRSCSWNIVRSSKGSESALN